MCELPIYEKMTLKQAILHGDDGIRTRDLCVANATLSQLSYVPDRPYHITRSVIRKVIL